MNKLNKLATLLFMLVIIGAGCSVATPADVEEQDEVKQIEEVEKVADVAIEKIKKQETPSAPKTEEVPVVDTSEKDTVKETPVEEKVKTFSFTGKRLAGNNAPFIDFNKTDYDNALRENRVVMLYFYATWCPLCIAELKETRTFFNELEDKRVVGLRVNFKDGNTDDFEKQLAKEFGVAYQHTKVILKDGVRVLKKPDTWRKDRYHEEINKILN